MNNINFDELIKQVNEHYEETVRLAEKERDQNLEAIERIKALSKEIREMPKANVKITTRVQAKGKLSYGAFTDAVKEAIERLSVKKFTKKDIRVILPQVSMEIAASCKDTSLIGCLNRLEKQGHIKKIKNGKGSSPNVYRKVSDS
jgi:hypothetical protein